jgi:hypothetical protein
MIVLRFDLINCPAIQAPNQLVCVRSTPHLWRGQPAIRNQFLRNFGNPRAARTGLLGEAGVSSLTLRKSVQATVKLDEAAPPKLENPIWRRLISAAACRDGRPSFRRWLDATQLGVREHVAKFHADRVRHANPIASAKLRSGESFCGAGRYRRERRFAANARLAPRAGFEPATIRLTVECSTAELPRNRRNNRSRAGSV